MAFHSLFGKFRDHVAGDGRAHVTAHTQLSRLAAVVLDTETTGMDPHRDRLLSLAAIAIDGLAIADEPVLDVLIDPGVPIPQRATHVHGIDADRIADAPDFAAIHDDLRHRIDGAVVIGHHVGFDLAVIAAEARRRGLKWRQPCFLDTARMAAAIDPHRRHLDLADLVRAHGIEPSGPRHHAASDARMAAELYVALARKLIGQGRGTLGTAIGL